MKGQPLQRQTVGDLLDAEHAKTAEPTTAAEPKPDAAGPALDDDAPGALPSPA